MTGDFDKLVFRAVIEGELENLTPLSIGSAGIGKLGSTDNPVITVNINGESIPYVPGSSLKGILRTEAERTAKTLGHKEVCNIFNHKSKCNQAETDKDLCIVCGIFGSQAIASHVKIMDAYPSTTDYSLSIEPGVAIDRATGAQRNKFDIQVVNPNARFRFRMIIENIDLRNSQNDRAKILRNLLEKLENGELQIGGKRSVGHGLVKLHNPTIKWIDEERLKKLETYETEPLAEFLGEN